MSTKYLDSGDSFDAISGMEVILRDAFSKVPEDIWDLPEEDLIKIIKPNLSVDMLRLRIWDLFYKWKLSGAKNTYKKPIKIKDICSGLCSPKFFQSKILNSYHMLCYLFTPPKKFKELYEASLYRSMHRVQQILDTEPLDTKTGRPNVNLMKLQSKIHDNMHVRVHGRPEENINIRQATVVHNSSPVEVNKLYQNADMKELEKIVSNSNKEDRCVDSGDDVGDDI